MRLLYVPLSAETVARVGHIAERDRRAPREQAAYLLERALEPLCPPAPQQAGAREDRDPVATGGDEATL